MTAPGKAITVGRVGSDIPLIPTNMTVTGDTISLSGTTGLRSDETPVRSRVQKQQLQGLATVNRRILPFTSEDAPELDGFCRLVNPPRIDIPSGAIEDGIMQWSMELERIPSWARPLVQSRLQGGVRPKPDGSANHHGISTANTLFWHSPGGGAYGYQPAQPTDYVRSGADGNELFEQDSAETLRDARPKWSVAPGDYYKGAAQVALQADDNMYYVLVGHQAENRPKSWALGNGLIVVLISSAANLTELNMLFHDGIGYSPAKTVRITTGNGYTDAPYEPTSWRLVRNSPERAQIRLYCWPADADYGIGMIDLVLRRGARHVECLLRMPADGAAQKFGIRLTTPEAGTGHTSGIHANSLSSGFRYVFSSPQEVSIDGTNGAMRLTNDNLRFAWMMGGAPGSSAPDDFTSIVYQYFAHGMERQRVIAA